LLDGIGFEVICHAANDARSGGRTAWLCRRMPQPAPPSSTTGARIASRLTKW
jgi:hypothetical protein